MYRLVFCLFVLFWGGTTYAQQIRGKVLTSGGEPLPYATVYIREYTLGIVTDAQGMFQTTIKPGTYAVEVSYVGYVSQTKNVTVPPEGVWVQFTLAEKIQNLNELTVRPEKGNPANEIMRRAIAKAPYHLYQIESYKSENYLKGSVKIDNIPALMKMMIKDRKLKSLIGKVLVLESQNRITFRTPSHYTQQVVAYKSSVPKEMEPKGGGVRVVTSNIYAGRYDDYISPLSPQAFRYYNFRLADITDNGQFTINKIQITPKIKQSSLYTGYIYIVDKLWNVYSLDLAVTEMGTTTRYKVNYQEVLPGAFMPITYNVVTNINTMGVTGLARFYSSVKYSNIKLNPAVSKVAVTPVAVSSSSATATKLLTNKQLQAQETIEKIASKKKLSAADAIRLAKLTHQSMEPAEVAGAKSKLEVRDSALVKFQIDSLASDRDSAYWESVRNVPLLTEEAESFLRKDTLPPTKTVKTTENTIEISFGNSGKNKKSGWFLGRTISLGDSASLSYNGLLAGVLKEYNFVDGLWLGQKLALNIKLPNRSNLNIEPWAYYTTARKNINWNTSFRYSYWPLNNGQLHLNIGNSTTDIQGEKGTSRLLNSLSSLIAADNVIRFYQSRIVRVENRIDLANGLFFNIGAAYEKRRIATNHTDFHLWGGSPQPNAPDAAYIAAFPENTITSISTHVEYTPGYRYRIKNGRKEYIESDYPTLTLAYRSAFKVGNDAEQASYNVLKFGVRQKIKVSEWSALSYQFTAGTFLTKDRLYAPDYNYFRTAPLAVSFTSLNNSFALLPNYSATVSDWVEGHLHLTSDYLLLKRIGFLQKLPLKESVQLNFLYDNAIRKAYSELGYGVGFSELLRVGVYASFSGFDFQHTGVKMSLSLK